MSDAPDQLDETDPTESDQAAPEPQTQPEPEKKRRWVGLPRPTSKRWGMNPEDRMRVMEACLVLPGAGWLTHFVLMMSMSVIVANMGLSLDSPALVIGAMLIAPLMTPVLGIAASVAMALGDATARAVVTVLGATAGAILVSYVVAGFLPGENAELLTSEVLARTAPDARDLVVALAAGIAGSYATARPDVSSSLPGVAIAVALVPPLAVVGITLRAGEAELARGAMLLYVTNLAAIVTVSTVVFIAAGFVPGRRLLSMAPRVIAGGLAALAVVGVLSVLLISRSLESAAASNDANDIRAATKVWLGASLNTFDVDVDGNVVRINVTGPSQLPSSAELKTRIADILDETPDLRVTWIQAENTDSLTAAEQERARSAEAQAQEEQRAETISQVVEDWLSINGGDEVYELTSLDIGFDQTVTVGVSSTEEPPSDADLELRLAEALDEELAVVVNFDDRSVAESQRAIQQGQAAARALVDDFAQERGLDVDDVSYDGEVLTADLRGQAPPDGADLEGDLRLVLGPQATIRVYFIERVPVIPAPTATPVPTPTVTPTATPVPTPTVDPEATPDTEATPDSDAAQETEPDE